MKKLPKITSFDPPAYTRYEQTRKGTVALKGKTLVFTGWYAIQVEKWAKAAKLTPRKWVNTVLLPWIIFMYKNDLTKARS